MPISTMISRRNLLIMPLALAACKPGTALLELTGLTMGTTYNVVALDHDGATRATDLRRAIETALAEVTATMSNWDPTSEISQLNARTAPDPVRLSPHLADVLQAAEDVHAASDGKFDVTVGPLIDLWGFGAGPGVTHTPGDPAIAAALARSGHRRALRLGVGTLRKTKPGATIYLSAIGKGYGVDMIARTLESFGLRNYMIEIGGDLYASGRNPDGLPWQIGIETPDARTRGLHRVVGVSNLGMATSGDYRNFFEEDGVRYSHIVDPGTGRPITHHTVSATVMTDNAMLADAWATAMLILGRERGLEIAEARNLAVLFIERVAETPKAQLITTPSTRFTELQA